MPDPPTTGSGSMVKTLPFHFGIKRRQERTVPGSMEAKHIFGLTQTAN